MERSGSEVDRITDVLLVDDHALVREALRNLLGGYPDLAVIGEACNGREAVESVEIFQPTIVVMDISMPVMNGIEATACIKAYHPRTIVIGLTVTTHPETLAAMIRAGAAMLLPKEKAGEELYAAIKRAVPDR